MEGPRRDVDAVGDLVDARGVEALGGEELQCGLDERLARGLLLALSEAGRHAAIVAKLSESVNCLSLTEMASTRPTRSARAGARALQR